MTNISEIVDAVSRVDDLTAQSEQGPGSRKFSPGHYYDITTGKEIPREPTPVLPRQGSIPTLVPDPDRNSSGIPPVYRGSTSSQLVDVVRSPSRLDPRPESAPPELWMLSPDQLLALDDDGLIAAMFAGSCGEHLEAYTRAGRNVTPETLDEFRGFLCGRLGSGRKEKRDKKSVATNGAAASDAVTAPPKDIFDYASGASERIRRETGDVAPSSDERREHATRLGRLLRKHTPGLC